MPEYLSPGVYVEEFDSGAQPMNGVSTGAAGFTGLAAMGPVCGKPQFITNMADFNRLYGGYLSEAAFGKYRFLAYAVEHFFINGGTRAYISRVIPQDAKKAKSTAESALTFHAANAGAWGNALTVTATPSSETKTAFNLEIRHENRVERYEDLSLIANSPHYISKRLSKSELVTLEISEIPDNPEAPCSLIFGDENEPEAIVFTL